MITLPTGFCHDPKERLSGVLGQDYFTSIINQGNMSKSTMILTNRRLYQIGKIYQWRGGKLITTRGKAVVTVRDITGTSWQEENTPGLLIIGCVFGMIALCMVIMGGIDVGACILFVCGVICLWAYLFERKRCFFVEYAGGAIGTICRWYSINEIESLQKNISLLKDNTMATTNSPIQDESSELKSASQHVSRSIEQIDPTTGRFIIK